MGQITEEREPRGALFDGEWWAAERYEVAQIAPGGAHVIRPVAGAPIRTTRPWDDYELDRSDRRPEQRQKLAPHTTFMALGGWWHEHGGRPPRAEEEKRAIAWCSRHGLPGQLLHDAVEIAYPSTGGSQLVWRRERAAWDGPSHSGYPGDSAAPGRVVLQGYSRTGKLAPDDYLETFLPSPFPRLDSDEFKAVYREPIDGFFDLAHYLWAVADHLLRSGLSDESADAALFSLKSLARTGEEVMVRDAERGGFKVVWRASTLIGHMARMVQLDLVGALGLRRCGFAGCFSVFAPRRSDEVFCTVQCRNAAARRRQRAKGKP